MAYTIQSAIDIARGPLNDTAKTRYADADLLVYARSYLQKAVRERPDLFFGAFSSLPDDSVAVGTAWPMPNSYIQVCADYITARAESRDDEHSVSGRAAGFFKLADGETS